MNEKLREITDLISAHDMENDFRVRFRVRKTLRKIPDQEIIEGIGMAQMPLIIYLLDLKYARTRIIPIQNDLVIRTGKLNAANMSYLAVYLHFLRIEKNVLHIEGNISLPAVFEKRNTFYIRCNGEKVRCEMSECGLDCKLGENIYEKRTVFCTQIPLEERDYKIEFFNCIDGEECGYGRINAMRFSPVADCLADQYCRFENRMVFIQDNFIMIQKVDSEETFRDREEKFRKAVLDRYEDIGLWAVDLRKNILLCQRKKKRLLWLFMDRPDRADDNAEVFFKYMQRHKAIDTCFVLDRNSGDYERLSSIGKVVDLYSEQHYLMAMLADYIISSQCNGVVENPFWEKSEFFRDLYHKPKLVFLQHGVIKDDMSRTLNRFHTNFTGFVTSTQAEYRSILDYPYFYSEREVWLTGLPVFDELEDKSKKIILLMPTWRQGLMHQEWNDESHNMQWKPVGNVEDSEYFRRYDSLLHNRTLLEACRKAGYQIAFMPHPLLEPYVSRFADAGEILLWDSTKSYREAFGEGSLLVTDYSSVAFEFVYLNKPVLYYQFDREEFFREHTYRKGYFDYERDGLGEVCCTEKELVQQICKYLENHCQLEEKYGKKIADLYPERDGKACERLYTQIKNVMELAGRRNLSWKK